MSNLLSNDTLENSAVVANCRMNRERDLAGRNGYGVEIGYCPIEFLRSFRVKNGAGKLSWLDLCCGTGNALIQAHQKLMAEFDDNEFCITGIDLAGMFWEYPNIPSLRLVECSLSHWSPGDERFDLITCVHGLHYLGDKLDLIMRAAEWLNPNGRFTANLDMENVVVEGYSSRVVSKSLRGLGFTFCTRRNRLFLEGQVKAQLPFQFLGSDDRAGPNYTGQPAVDSHYRRIG